jgi:predicted enzyme related to lactoylglutathione lyase
MPTLGHGKVCHIALPAPDVEASARFYSDVFGWRIRHQPHAVTFDDGVDEVSGHFVPHRSATPPGMLVYLWVDDLDTAIKRLEEAGASIVEPPGIDPGERTAWFNDPAGNTLGIYQEPNGDGSGG